MMSSVAISIRTLERPGVLSEITGMLAARGINITYAHLYVERDGYGSIYMELEDIDDVDGLVEEIRSSRTVVDVRIHRSLEKIYGKRIIIIGGGAQVSQVAMGAISEADRHNIRGERISIDTIPSWVRRTCRGRKCGGRLPGWLHWSCRFTHGWRHHGSR